MPKTEQAPQSFHFQKNPNTSKVTVLNNLNYVMGEYDETTGVTRWTRVVAATQRESVQKWLLTNYPVIEAAAAAPRRRKAA